MRVPLEYLPLCEGVPTGIGADATISLMCAWCCSTCSAMRIEYSRTGMGVPLEYPCEYPLEYPCEYPWSSPGAA
jgi:hypothetical protein